MSSKICHVFTIILGAVLIMSFPAITIADIYVSKSPPSDALIIKKASQLDRCAKGIKKIVGKLQVSDNVWIVYYEYVNEKGKTFWGNEMKLKKLDTNIWICECGDIILGGNFGAINE